MGKGLNQLEELKDDGIHYVKLKWASLRLSAVENISILLSKAFGYIIFIALIFIALIFMMIALSLWIGEMLGHLSFGFLISGGVFLIGGLVVYFVHDRLIINALVRHFIDLVFSDKDDDNGTQK